MEVSHEADVSGADLPRTIAHGRHILKALGYSISRRRVRFLLASRSQGEPQVAAYEWKWMENWWTNNNRCPGERVERVGNVDFREKFITAVFGVHVCLPTRNGKPARHKHNCVTQRGGKMTRFEHSLISYYLISFEFELKYSDNFFDNFFSIREDRAAIYRRIEKCIQLYYCRNCIFIRNISRDNIEKNIRT